MHAITRDALAVLGIPTRLGCPEGERGRDEALCFLHQTAGDLLLGESKIAGSAQRKLRGALVQHGGILLAQSLAAPELPGIAELTGYLLSPEEVYSAVAEQFARATGWRLVPGEWEAEEVRQIDALVAGKYATPAWNERR
jgi:lipoate-protein ligase A